MSSAPATLHLRPARTSAEAPRVVLIIPPGLPGRTNDRTLSGGIGVSRKLKPFERVGPAIPPIDFLYLAAVAERAGAAVTLLDLLVLEEGLLEPTMRFSDWNSYTATVRTYALTTRDLQMARWWARMETILPYRRRRAAAAGPSALAQSYLRHVPHYAWRRVCRTYVWLRRRTAPIVRPPVSATPTSAVTA